MSLSSYSENAGRLISGSLAILLGIAEPSEAWLAFAAQVRREVADGAEWAAGVRYHNPLNLTTAGGQITWPAQTGTYSGGNEAEWHGDFAAFGTLAAGCWACAANYDGGSYPGVLDAYRSGDPIAIARAIQDSPWDSGHYAGTLVDEVRAEQGEDMTPDQVRAIVADYLAAIYGPALEEELHQRFGDNTQTDIASAIAGAVRAVGQKLTQ